MVRTEYLIFPGAFGLGFDKVPLISVRYSPPSPAEVLDGGIATPHVNTAIMHSYTNSFEHGYITKTKQFSTKQVRIELVTTRN